MQTMNRFFVIVSCLLTVCAHAQKNNLSGRIVDDQTGEAVASAAVSINGSTAIANGNGEFFLGRLTAKSGTLRVQAIGYAELLLPVSNVLVSPLTVRLVRTRQFLQPLEVKALRAGDQAPFTKTNISKETIAANNLGQDLPFILNQTPSVYVSSDAGNGVGYTYLHIRGSDATRINVTLNGIPYNDAESQGTYFVDLPDFASSLSSIQIQRGVGTSSNGTGAFGATINLATNEVIDHAYAESNNSFGSFNTWKNTLKAGTGLIDGHFTVDARLSRISSDGYIDRAATDLRSLGVSAAWLSARSSLRFNVFSGKEKTYQAWYGVPDNLLATDPTYNPAGTEKPGTPYDNQTDNYQQDHYQLFFNHLFPHHWSMSTAAFLTYGRGYYEEYKAAQLFSDYGLPAFTVGATVLDSTDLVRQRWLDNYFYGQIFSLQYKSQANELTFGGGWTDYDGKHYGTVIWAQYGIDKDYKYYDYPARKTDYDVYLKWQHRLAAGLESFADVQYRHVYHHMDGFEGNPALNITRTFDFFLPKLGLTYSRKGWQASFSYALGQKEPNRDDFQASLVSQPNAETLHDFELGLQKRGARFHAGATVYYMLYKDQLVLTGKINDVGSYTRTNVPDSYRLGLELEGSYIFSKWMNMEGNIAFSRNKITTFTEFIDNYDNGLQNAVVHHNTDISFSPSIIGAATVNFVPAKDLHLALMSKYVGDQYLDNTQDAARKLGAFYTQDIRVTYTIRKWVKELSLILQVNNVFNRRYEPNGYTYSYISSGALTTQNSYYPMAGTNFMAGVNMKW